MKTIKSIITATCATALMAGCSQPALYSQMTDENYQPKPKTCDIPISREPLQEGQKKIGEVTIFQQLQAGIFCGCSNKPVEEAMKEAKEKACSVGADGIANYREVSPSGGLSSNQLNSKGDLYVNEN